MERNIIVITLISLASMATAQEYLSVGVESAKAKYSSYEFVNPRVEGMFRDNNKPLVASLSVAYGRQYNGFRGELELVSGSKAKFSNYHLPWLENSQDKEVRSYRLMGKIYKDFDTAYALKPFIGASLGLAYNTAEGFQSTVRAPFEKKSTLALAYGVSAGARYSFDQTSHLSLAYQYVNAGRSNTGINQFFLNDEQFKGKFVTSGIHLVYTKSL